MYRSSGIKYTVHFYREWSPAKFEFASASSLRLMLCNYRSLKAGVALPLHSSTLYVLIWEKSSVRMMMMCSEALVLSHSLHHKLVTLLHSGHQGMVKAQKRLWNLYWWPGIDIKSHNKSKDDSWSCNSTTASNFSISAVGDGAVFRPLKITIWDCKYTITLTDFHSKRPVEA